MTILDDMLLKAARQEGKKSNLRDITLGSVESGPAAILGYTLQCMPDESRKSFPLSFDPVQSLFIDKLISEEALRKRIKAKKEGFFRCAVMMDYAATIFFASYDVLDRIARRAPVGGCRAVRPSSRTTPKSPCRSEPT